MEKSETVINHTCVIIPTYNNGGTVADVVARALQQTPHVIVVNDGSDDDTLSALQPFDIILVSYARNRGKGHALKQGFRKARELGFRYAVTLDADGQHQVKDVIRMVQRLRTEPLDIIVGTRFGRPKSDHDQVPWIKRLVLQTVVLLSRKTRKLGLTDAHNGLRAFNRRVADELNIRMNGMSHASEIVSQIVDNQWRVSEEPVDILYTEYSMSKGQSLINGVNILADGLLVKENLI